VAAGSTVAAVAIAMALVAEAGALLAKKKMLPPTFVSPNVQGVPKGHMDKVYEAFAEFYYARPWRSRRPKPGKSVRRA